jgi:hypothetical protein
MLRQWLFVALRSIPIGWGILLFIAFCLKHPLLVRIVPILGVEWLQTVGMALDCTALVATGWTVGRVNRTNPMLGVLVFAATLTFRDFTPWMAINIPWLPRLAVDTWRDQSYWSSLITTTVTQALLFGSLLAGGLLSRRPLKPLSIRSINK